jgi:hypothetical protein
VDRNSADGIWIGLTFGWPAAASVNGRRVWGAWLKRFAPLPMNPIKDAPWTLSLAATPALLLVTSCEYTSVDYPYAAPPGAYQQAAVYRAQAFDPYSNYRGSTLPYRDNDWYCRPPSYGYTPVISQEYGHEHHDHDHDDHSDRDRDEHRDHGDDDRGREREPERDRDRDSDRGDDDNRRPSSSKPVDRSPEAINSQRLYRTKEKPAPVTRPTRAKPQGDRD